MPVLHVNDAVRVRTWSGDAVYIDLEANEQAGILDTAETTGDVFAAIHACARLGFSLIARRGPTAVATAGDEVLLSPGSIESMTYLRGS